MRPRARARRRPAAASKRPAPNDPAPTDGLTTNSPAAGSGDLLPGRRERRRHDRDARRGEVAQVDLVGVPLDDVGGFVHAAGRAASEESGAVAGVVPHRADHDQRVAPVHVGVGPHGPLRRRCRADRARRSPALRRRHRPTIRRRSPGARRPCGRSYVRALCLPGARAHPDICDHRGSHSRTGRPTVADAGWYPDPSDPSSVHYWDGKRWTGDRRPMAPAPTDAVVAQATRNDPRTNRPTQPDQPARRSSPPSSSPPSSSPPSSSPPSSSGMPRNSRGPRRLPRTSSSGRISRPRPTARPHGRSSHSNSRRSNTRHSNTRRSTSSPVHRHRGR